MQRRVATNKDFQHKHLFYSLQLYLHDSPFVLARNLCYNTKLTSCVQNVGSTHGSTLITPGKSGIVIIWVSDTDPVSTLVQMHSTKFNL